MWEPSDTRVDYWKNKSDHHALKRLLFKCLICNLGILSRPTEGRVTRLEKVAVRY